MAQTLREAAPGFQPKENTSPSVIMPPDIENKLQPLILEADTLQFADTSTKVGAIVDFLACMEATSPATCTALLDKLKETNGILQTVEAKRKELVKPLNDRVKKINEYAGGLADRLVGAIASGKDRVLAWQKAEEEKLEQIRYEARGKQLQALGMVRNSADTGYESRVTWLGDSVIKHCTDRQWTAFVADIIHAIDEDKAAEIRALKEELKDNLFMEDEEKEAVQAKITEAEQKTVAVTGTIAFGGSFGSTKVKGATKTWTYEIEADSEVPRAYLMINHAKIREDMVKGVRSIPGVRIYQKDGITLR